MTTTANPLPRVGRSLGVTPDDETAVELASRVLQHNSDVSWKPKKAAERRRLKQFVAAIEAGDEAACLQHLDVILHLTEEAYVAERHSFRDGACDRLCRRVWRLLVRHGLRQGEYTTVAGDIR